MSNTSQIDQRQKVLLGMRRINFILSQNVGSVPMSENNKISLKQDKPAKMYTKSVFKSVLEIRQDIKHQFQVLNLVSSTEISFKY